MKQILLIIPLLLFSLNCGSTMDEKAEEEHHAENGLVEITNAQINAADIKLGYFEKRNLRTSVKADGVLELPPQNKANVSPLLEGTVKSILVNEGEFVKENQILALLEHPQFIEIQQEFLESLNRFKFIEQEYERKKKLFDENISSGKEFQETQAEYNIAKSKANAFKAKLKLLNLSEEEVLKGKISTSIPVKAPIHGYVKNIGVNIGAFVEPQKDMFEIVDNHHIHIDLLVYESDINKIKKGQKVIFRVSNRGNIDFTAKIFAVGKSFEEDLKAVRIHAEIENPDNKLIPGMYVTGRIIVDDFKTNTLPETAILREGENAFIFIKNEGEHTDKKVHSDKEENGEEDEHVSFKKVPVQIGETENGFTEVFPFPNSHKGFEDSAQVVLQGAYYLDSEMNKGKGGHHH